MEPLICRDDLEGRGEEGIRPVSVLTGGNLTKEEVYINKPWFTLANRWQRNCSVWKRCAIYFSWYCAERERDTDRENWLLQRQRAGMNSTHSAMRDRWKWKMFWTTVKANGAIQARGILCLFSNCYFYDLSFTSLGRSLCSSLELSWGNVKQFAHHVFCAQRPVVCNILTVWSFFSPTPFWCHIYATDSSQIVFGSFHFFRFIAGLHSLLQY